jgi:hypothetical protein
MRLMELGGHDLSSHPAIATKLALTGRSPEERDG